MNTDPMDGDIAKLIKLLKKILRAHPQGSELSKFLGDKPVNLNLCFLTFVPMTPEELDEFEEMYDDYMSRYEESVSGDRQTAKLEFKLNSDDLNFLKENGLQF